MPKDFAARHHNGKRKRTRSAPSRARPKARVLFHGPSFSFGALAGAAVVILAAYAPELLEQSQEPVATETRQTIEPIVEFVFPKELPEAEVRVDPSPYQPAEPEPGTLPTAYAIQAASFRSREDANTLRARLILEDLPAQVELRSVDRQTWYRVGVGPFERKVEADRAMTRLREMNLQPIWMNKHN